MKQKIVRPLTAAAVAALATTLAAGPAAAAPVRPGGVLLVSEISATRAYEVRTGRALATVGAGRDATVARLRTAYVRDVDPCHPDVEGCFGAPDLLLAGIAGGPERLLVHNPEAQGGVSRPDLSPDGSTIVYSWNTPGERGLNLVRADGTGNEQIVPFTGPGTFSPDGRSIAFVKDGDVQVIDVATRAVRRVSGEGQAEMTGVDWSPDGRTLVYAGTSTIYTVPAAGGPSVPADFWPAILSFLSSPVFAPDGRRVAFTAYDGPRSSDETGTTRLFTAALDGSALTPVTDTYHQPTEWLGLPRS
jgi:TolB protein